MGNWKALGLLHSGPCVLWQGLCLRFMGPHCLLWRTSVEQGCVYLSSGGYHDLAEAIAGLSDLMERRRIEDSECSIASCGSWSNKRARLDSIIVKHGNPSQTGTVGDSWPHKLANWLLGKDTPLNRDPAGWWLYEAKWGADHGRGHHGRRAGRGRAWRGARCGREADGELTNIKKESD
jgi:hypothetical protein